MLVRKIGDIIKDGRESSHVAKFFNLSAIWRAATTKNVAEASVPVKLRDGNLLVLVSDGIWLTELNYMKDQIIGRLNEHGLSIKTITFKGAPALARYEKPQRQPNKITEQENFYIEKFAEPIDNENLKASFKNAMRAYFTRYTFEEFINGTFK